MGDHVDTLVDVAVGLLLSTVAENCEFLRVGEEFLDNVGMNCLPGAYLNTA